MKKGVRAISFKSARLKSGKSVQEVMKELDVSDAAIYQWETGENLPKTSRLKAIADCYGCTVDELLSEDS